MGPGAHSRIQRAGRNRARLPREPGRGFSQNVSLDLELAVLATQPREFVTLRRCHGTRRIALIHARLKEPVPNRLLRRFELRGELLGGAAGARQGDDLFAVTGGGMPSDDWPSGKTALMESKAPPKRVNSIMLFDLIPGRIRLEM